MTTHELPVTGDPEANELLMREPFALLIGMLLDQQVPMEWAFKAPHTLKERLGGQLDPGKLAAMAPEQVEELFKQKPALHRFPGAMGKRTHAVAVYVTEHYDGDTQKLWTDAKDGADLYDRLRALPGYGDEKAKIFMAVLGKRLGIQLDGWREVAAPFSDDTPRSVADIDSDDALQRVRAFKKEMKSQGKGKSD